MRYLGLGTPRGTFGTCRTSSNCSNPFQHIIEWSNHWFIHWSDWQFGAKMRSSWSRVTLWICCAALQDARADLNAIYLGLDPLFILPSRCLYLHSEVNISSSPESWILYSSCNIVECSWPSPIMTSATHHRSFIQGTCRHDLNRSERGKAEPKTGENMERAPSLSPEPVE